MSCFTARRPGQRAVPSGWGRRGLGALTRLVAGLALGCVAPAPRPAEPPRVIFSSDVRDGDPVDSLGRTTLAQKKLCLWVKWFDFDAVDRRYRSEIRDGAGQLLYVGKLDLKRTNDTTWDCYHPVAAVDQPGFWEFRIWIDDQLTLERKLVVTSE